MKIGAVYKSRTLAIITKYHRHIGNRKRRLANVREQFIWDIITHYAFRTAWTIQGGRKRKIAKREDLPPKRDL